MEEILTIQTIYISNINIRLLMKILLLVMNIIDIINLFVTLKYNYLKYILY